MSTRVPFGTAMPAIPAMVSAVLPTIAGFMDPFARSRNFDTLTDSSWFMQ